MDWYKTTLYPACINLTWAIVRTEPALRDRRRIADLQSKTDESLALLDRHLALTGHVVGNRLTMADIPFGALCFRYRNLELERPDVCLDGQFDSGRCENFSRHLVQRCASRSHGHFLYCWPCSRGVPQERWCGARGTRGGGRIRCERCRRAVEDAFWFEAGRRGRGSDAPERSRVAPSEDTGGNQGVAGSRRWRTACSGHRA